MTICVTHRKWWSKNCRKIAENFRKTPKILQIISSICVDLRTKSNNNAEKMRNTMKYLE